MAPVAKTRASPAVAKILDMCGLLTLTRKRSGNRLTGLWTDASCTVTWWKPNGGRAYPRAGWRLLLVVESRFDYSSQAGDDQVGLGLQLRHLLREAVEQRVHLVAETLLGGGNDSLDVRDEDLPVELAQSLNQIL